MTLHGVGSAEQGIHGDSGGVYKPLNESIVSSPALSGTYSYEIDPVNGNVTLETYGWKTSIPTPDYWNVPFLVRNAADYDANITIAVVGGEGLLDDFIREIVLTNNEALAIFDKDEDEVGTTVDSYIVAGTTYNFLWHYDQRDLTNTRDMLWIYKLAATLSAKTTISFSDANPDTISDSASGFGIFSAGMIITVSGSTSNDGTYTIASLTEGVITLVSGDELTTESAGDTVTITHSAQWYTAIDVSGHGDGIAGGAELLTFGTPYGKGLPTTGSPFHVDDMCLQDLENGPNQHPLGSITAKLKMPTANGTDGDFNTGVGTSPHPDFTNVDEIPGNEATDYDEGDVDEDFQSYAVADADSGDDVLAVQVVGQGSQLNTGNGDVRSYIHDGAARDEQVDTFTFSVGGWTRIVPPTNGLAAYNQINGVNLSETLFNTLEAGIHITTLESPRRIRLSQIGLEYAIPGPRELPRDFPRARAGVALGSGNMGII